MRGVSDVPRMAPGTNVRLLRVDNITNFSDERANLYTSMVYVPCLTLYESGSAASTRVKWLTFMLSNMRDAGSDTLNREIISNAADVRTTAETFTYDKYYSFISALEKKLIRDILTKPTKAMSNNKTRPYDDDDDDVVVEDDPILGAPIPDRCSMTSMTSGGNTRTSISRADAIFDNLNLQSSGHFRTVASNNKSSMPVKSSARVDSLLCNHLLDNDFGFDVPRVLTLDP